MTVRSSRVPCAPLQICSPLTARLIDAGLPSTMFEEQHRMALSLHEPSSSIWYQSRITCSPATEGRVEVEKATKWRDENVGSQLRSKIPRVVYDLRKGIQMKNTAGSRFNMHNVAFLMNKLPSLADTFGCSNIVIMTPYRAQAAKCRAAIVRASHTKAWADTDHNIFDIRTVTIDSFQGGESECVIL